MKRKVEVFSAGCPACQATVDLIKSIACPSCEITVLDMQDVSVAARAKSPGRGDAACRRARSAHLLTPAACRQPTRRPPTAAGNR
jgi:hypothetical protein